MTNEEKSSALAGLEIELSGAAGTIDFAAIQAYRLRRIRQRLAAGDVAGLVLFDPVNIRYATGSRNMQVWTMHNFCRYVFIATDGPVVAFELGSAKNLTAALDSIDEVRPSVAWDYMLVGERAREMADRWAEEIADLVKRHGGGNRRVAVDRLDWLPGQALMAVGIVVEDGKSLTERARSIKSDEELKAMRLSFRACEVSIAALKEAVAPGMREQEALARLIETNVALGGEYPETRLMTSGPRTNPWFQETSDRPMAAGELLSFDTDLIGPFGFYTDISRSWVIGDKRPTDQQRRMYEYSVRQLNHNIDLLRPGVGFIEYAERSFPLPEHFLANRYADIAHGCGMGVEYPMILYPEDREHGLYDGQFEAGMVVCVESYIGAEGGVEGVKLEQPVLITDAGPQLFLTDCPLQEDYL